MRQKPIHRLLLHRLLLWSLPALVAGLLLVTLRHADESARLSEAEAALVAGDPATARELLRDMAASSWNGTRARAALAVVRALEGRDARPDDASLDASRHPLALYARLAFDRGDFTACLRLGELAESLGRPAVAAVTAAALIEQGRIDEARRVRAPGAEPIGRLARRVEHYLSQPPPDGAVVVRDRQGRLIGTATPGGSLTLAENVRPELVPRAVDAVISDPGDGRSLHLSLELAASELAFEALGRYRGSIVVVEARTGEILAAVSDRQTWLEGGTPAFEQRREPASIAKLITTTAAQRAGLDPDAELAEIECRGHRRYAGRLLYCPYIAGPLRGLRRALAVSCNVAFADLGVRVGRRRLVEEFRRYGFDSALPGGAFPGGRVLRPWGDERQLADLAIGLEATDITPLHAALMAAVMANDGVMPAPTLLDATDGRLGFHPQPFPSAPGRPVIEPQWLPPILDAMEAVARDGTAARLAPYGFPVAMKTGTASDPRSGFHVNYIGIGPMPRPRLAFCVRITHQRTSRRVRRAAHLITRNLLYGLRDLGGLDEPAP
ncbi:MAG: hypothetical protein GY856_54580 [bacterium]|nr:hypothetical protein [bacterium]